MKTEIRYNFYSLKALSICLLLVVKVNAQLSFDQFLGLKLGSEYSLSKSEIASYFSKKPIISKGDFLSTYKIVYERVPFHYFGNADYTFNYVDNKLTHVEVSYKFFAQDTNSFRRMFTTLLTDLKNDKTKKRLDRFSTLQFNHTLDYVKKNSKLLSNVSYSQLLEKINSINLGSDFWSANKDYLELDDFILQIDVFFGARYINGGIANEKINEYPHYTILEQGVKYSKFEYIGSCAQIDLVLFNRGTQDLKQKAYNTDITFQIVNDTEQSIPLDYKNGVYSLPVNINGIVTLDFILDLGASDVSLGPDVFFVLYRSGTIKEDDFIGTQTYQFADGTTAKSRVFNLKTLKIGDVILNNVRASINDNVDAPLLLGQSALKKLSSYRIDNKNNKLIIE